MTASLILGLAPPALAAAAGIVFGAAFIRGLTGFGMAIVMVPLLGLVIPPADAVVLAILLQFLIGPVGLRTIIADSERATAVPIALAAVAATPAGIALLAVTPPELARLLIALIAIGAFVAILVPMREAAGAPVGRAVTALTGVAAGILTGFAAMPGPPVVPFYLRREVSPLVARASMMLVFFATAIAGTATSVVGGLATLALGLLALALFLPMLAGNWLGSRAFGRVAPALWRTMVGVILGIAGIGAVARLVA